MVFRALAGIMPRLLFLLLLLMLSAEVQAQVLTYTTNNGTITITGYTGPGGDLTIPSAINGLPVTGIGDFAFMSAPLTNVTLPDTLNSMGNGAFSGCRGLNSTVIPSGVTNIGQGAFSQCSSLINVSIPSGVRNIEQYTFYNCSSLTNVIISNGIITIGALAFTCPKLINVTIPDSVLSMDEESFEGCSSLPYIFIPQSVTNIGGAAFSHCSSLQTIAVSGSNGFYASVEGVLFNKSQTTLVACPGSKTNTYVIPKGVTTIGASAFEGCGSLVSVVVPSSVTKIEQVAFAFCSAQGIYFEGNAPTAASIFNSVPPNVYYLPGTEGWGPTFSFNPTAPWILPYPVILNGMSSFGVRNNQFGFTVSWATNVPVVIEASADLNHPCGPL